jgi:hypothetical protein
MGRPREVATTAKYSPQRFSSQRPTASTSWRRPYTSRPAATANSVPACASRTDRSVCRIAESSRL